MNRDEAVREVIDDILRQQPDVEERRCGFASDYVTGQLIYVDGGYMCGEPWPIDPPVS